MATNLEVSSDIDLNKLEFVSYRPKGQYSSGKTAPPAVSDPPQPVPSEPSVHSCEIVCLSDITELDKVLDLMQLKLEQLGELECVAQMQTQCRHVTVRGQVVLAQFVGLLRGWSQHQSTIVLLREVNPQCKCRAFIKVILHRKLGESFYLSLKSRKIVRGDIMSLINPVIFPNTQFIPDLQKQFYILEAGLFNKEKMIIFKVKDTIKLDISNLEKSEVEATHPSTREDSDQEMREEPAPDSHEVAFIFKLLKPLSLSSEFGFVIGYCSRHCNKPYDYSSIVWTVLMDPLCPSCYLKLTLTLRLEMKAFLKNGRFIIVILVGKDAEQFLEVSCKEILESEDIRKKAISVLTKKINEAKETPIQIMLDDVTHWKLI